MSTITVERRIAASAEVVFRTVADIRQFSQAIPEIVKYEFLSDIQQGVGTRFRETRLMRGKEAVTELDVKEYVANRRVRMVADSHGTIWDTVFDLKPVEDGTKLTAVMDARSYKLLPKIMFPFIRGIIRTKHGCRKNFL